MSGTTADCRDEEHAFPVLARSCARLAAGIVAVYAGFLFWCALQSGIWLLTGGPRVYDVPPAELRAWNAQGLVTGLVLGVMLSLLARGLYRLQFWAGVTSLGITACLALFYLLNCLQFRWFTLWLVPIPVMLILLLVSVPAMAQHRR